MAAFSADAPKFDVLELAKKFEDAASSLRQFAAEDGSWGPDSLAAAEALLRSGLDALERLSLRHSSEERRNEIDGTLQKGSVGNLEESSTQPKEISNDGQYGVFGTPERSDDGLQIMEIREEPTDEGVREPVGQARRAHEPVRAVSPITALSDEDVAFLEHFKKWEEIEVSQEKEKAQGVGRQKTQARKQTIVPGRKSVTLHEGSKSAASNDVFKFNTPGDIFTFMSRAASKKLNTSSVPPKVVRFADDAPATPAPKPPAPKPPANPAFIADNVMEHEVEEPPTEEDLDAYFDFKEAMEKYRDMRPRILDEESENPGVDLVKEIVPPQLQREEMNPIQIPVLGQVGEQARNADVPPPARKPSRFKMAMQKEKV